MRLLLLFVLSTFTFLDSHSQINNIALPVNSFAPEFTAVDHLGDTISSKEILESSDYIVLIFYRGNWCSYCKMHLSSLQDSLPLLLDRNATVIAVTPEQNESIAQMVGKTGAKFSIIHDIDYKIMKAYNVDYIINNLTVTKYLGPVQTRAAKANGNDDGILPVPATYLIGKNGLIKWVQFNPDYTKRSSIGEIIEAMED